MKKFVIICLLIFVFFILKNIMFYKIYSSKDDKKLAQIIENSIDLISKDVLNDYNSEFNFSDVDYICFPISIYSITAKEIVNGLSLKYKNATYLELKKQFSGGEMPPTTKKVWRITFSQPTSIKFLQYVPTHLCKAAKAFAVMHEHDVYSSRRNKRTTESSWLSCRLMYLLCFLLCSSDSLVLNIMRNNEIKQNCILRFLPKMRNE